MRGALFALAIMGLCAGPAVAADAILVIPAKFADALPFAEGLAAVKQDGKWGFIDARGFVAIEPAFEEVTGFSEKVAAARVGPKWGYINPQGEFQLAADLDFASRYSHGFSTFGVLTGGVMHYGVFNNRWALVTLPKWGEKLDFSEGPAVVRTANGKPYMPVAAPPPPKGPFKFGYINLNGDYLIPAKFDGGLAFRDGLAAVEAGGKWGYVDFDGKMVIAPQFGAGGYFSEGLAAEAGTDGKFGYIDKEGHFAIPATFDEARDFSEGLAAVKLADKWGYIDKSGTFVITPQFADAHAFGQGLAPVKLGALWGYVGK